MGQVWSFLQSSPTCKNVTINCSLASPDLVSDSTAAGMGTFLAFTLTATLTLLLSLSIIITQWLEGIPSEYRNIDEEERKRLAYEDHKSHAVREAVLINFSDQQLITGISMAISTRFFYPCTMSAYHYDIVCYLLLCSVVTHLCSLIAVDRYFFPFTISKASSVLGFALMAVRIVGILTTLILTGLVLFNRDQKTFPVQPPPTIDPQKPLDLLKPAICYFVGAEDTVANILTNTINKDTFGSGVSKIWNHGLINYVAYVLFTLLAFPVALMHSLDRGLCSRKPSSKVVLLFRSLIWFLSAALTVVVMVQAWKLRTWMHGPGKLEPSGWSFGQIIALGIIMFAFVTGLDEAAEKYDLKKLAATTHMPLGDAYRRWESGYSLGQM